MSETKPKDCAERAAERIAARLFRWGTTRASREATAEIAAIIRSERVEPAPCRHENIELPVPQDEQGRRAQYPATVRCPACGADVEVR